MERPTKAPRIAYGALIRGALVFLGSNTGWGQNCRWSSWRCRARDKTDQERDPLHFLDRADGGIEGGVDSAERPDLAHAWKHRRVSSCLPK
jgi:hypothetical protein